MPGPSDPFSWVLEIVDKVDFTQAPVPDWVTETEHLVAACEKHEWELELEHPDNDSYVQLGCAKCPAGMDDFYPDGFDMVFVDLNEVAPGVIVEQGRHNSLVPMIVPVTATVLTFHHSTPNGEDWDVELNIEPRGPVRLVEYADEDPDTAPQDTSGFPT